MIQRKFNQISNFFKRLWNRLGYWIFTILVLLAIVSWGLISLIPKRESPKRLWVYAFSTQEEAFTQGIFPAFEQQWKEDTGEEVLIEGVFGPSGTLAGQINLGAPADVAIFSNSQQVSWLKYGRLVNRDSQPLKFGATPIVILTRPGNPAAIKEFKDLARPGFNLIHPDPRSSGVGEWAVLAEYGSAYLETNNPNNGKEQLISIWNNVRILASSARAGFSLFTLGTGDLLITYEQDALLALEKGFDIEVIVPSWTIIAQPVAIAVDKNVAWNEREIVKAFINFLSSDLAQTIFMRFYMRPLELNADGFPSIDEPFTVDDLGGWSDAYTNFVEMIWESEIQPNMDLESVFTLMESGD